MSSRLERHSGRIVWSVVVAAGRGDRFGGPKQFADLDGRPVAAWAVDACRRVSDGVVLVVPPGTTAVKGISVDRLVDGGASRSESVRRGLAGVPEQADVIVVHDAARPRAPERLFEAVIAEVIAGADAAVPAVAVSDTLKAVAADGLVLSTIDRSGLVAVQTPQAFRAGALRAAHGSAPDATDDAALVEVGGGRVVVVDGDPANLKITTAQDLATVRRGQGQGRLRIGHGFDVHRWAEESRPLILGGVEIEYDRGLEGHSDADAVCHAVADSLLGAAGLGDLGRHFPDDDERWRGIRSTMILEEVARMSALAGWAPISVDVTVVAEAPRLAPHVDAMTARLTAILGAPVSVKATRAEGLGALGRSEGLAAWAVALLSDA